MKPTVQWLEYNFDTFNVKYFEGKLPKPKFSLFCKEGDLGDYTPQAEYNTVTRKVTKLTGPGVLSIAGQYSRSERDIASTLLHEMIHMYIFTVLKINPRFAHGDEFKKKSEQINRDGFNISEKNELIITDKDEPQRGRTYMVGIITKPQGQNYKLWAFRLEKKFVNAAIETAKKLVPFGAATLQLYQSKDNNLKKLRIDMNTLNGVGGMNFPDLIQKLGAAIGSEDFSRESLSPVDEINLY